MERLHNNPTIKSTAIATFVAINISEWTIMNEVIEDIDLSSYSVEQLIALSEEANREIVRQEEGRVLAAQREMKQLASGLNMTVEEVIYYGARNKKRKSTKTVGEIRYQNTANPEQTWTGRGKQPNWLKEALERGASKEDFLVAWP